MPSTATKPSTRKKTGVNKAPTGIALRVQKLQAKSPQNGNYKLQAPNPDKPLTEKQREFVRHWAMGETILSAANRAGYADGGTMCYRMAKDPAILKFYNREKALYEESCAMSRKKVMDMLLEAYDVAKLVTEPASMVSAAREIGRMCGYYEPVKRTIDINVKGNVTVKQLERASDEDLLKLIKGEASGVDFLEQVVAEEIESAEDEENE